MKEIIAKYWAVCFAAFVSFYTPISPYINIVGTAVVLDFGIAVYAAVKKDGWSAFESKRAKDTVAKTFIYMGAIILTRQVDLVNGTDVIMRVIFGVILLTELRSIDEKYYALYKKSLFKWIIESLPNMNKHKEQKDANKDDQISKD